MVTRQEEVPVHGITQGHKICRQNACDHGRFQASLHKNQGFVSTGTGGGGNVGFAMTFPDTMWRGNASYSGCVCTRNKQPETKSVGSWEAAILKRAAFQGR